MRIKKFVSILLFFLLSNGIAKKPKDTKASTWPPAVRTSDKKIHKSIQSGAGSLCYYSFNNIRYGQVNSRFSEPASVCNRAHKSCRKKISEAISKSAVPDNRIPDHPKCPQATPDWLMESSHTLRALSMGQLTKSIEARGDKQSTTSNYVDTINVSDDENEDCLFLDVLVPKKVWDKTQNHPELGYAPVVIRIHDGGFAFGDKSLRQDPSFLFNRSLEVNDGGIIVVTINYRLGLFGFLSSDSKSVSNVGLLDQRMALGWVQNNIEKFGGDRFRITVIGQGAGASSIMHHITAPNITKNLAPLVHPPSGHQRKFPFRSAILHSPTFQPLIPSQSRANMAKVLAIASALTGKKIESVSKLRQLPYKILYAVNRLIIHGSTHGSFTFGPEVDFGENSYVPDFPLRRLNAGLKPDNVGIVVGHMINEGRFFVPSTASTDRDFRLHIGRVFPTMPKRDIEYIVNSLYPSHEYENSDEGGLNRSIEAIDDLLISCNVYYLSNLMKVSYGYLIDIKAKSREQVLEKIFFSGTFVEHTTKTDAIQEFQNELVQFVMLSEQGAQFSKLRHYHRKQDSQEVTHISVDGIDSYISDPTAKNKCEFWADVPYALAP